MSTSLQAGGEGDGTNKEEGGAGGCFMRKCTGGKEATCAWAGEAPYPTYHDTNCDPTKHAGYTENLYRRARSNPAVRSCLDQ